MENPIKMDNLGVPLFLSPGILVTAQIGENEKKNPRLVDPWDWNSSCLRGSAGVFQANTLWGTLDTKMCWSKPGGSSKSLPIMVRDFRYP